MRIVTSQDNPAPLAPLSCRSRRYLSAVAIILP